MLFRKRKIDPNASLSDAELVQLAKSDHRQFGLLYEKYFELIFRFVFKRLGGDEENSGDITQQTFMKAMGALKQYEERGYPFSTWLYRIAQNEVNMFYRQQSKHFTVEVEERHVITLMEEMQFDTTEQDAQEKLIELLNALKPEQLDLIELRFFQQLSFKEIADIYGITEANAKMRIYRILEKMQQNGGTQS